MGREEQKFDSRYADAFHWIKRKISTGSKQGILNLIFWRLPLIFIEGKIIAAFFGKPGDSLPALDTVRIPNSKIIFSYSAFIKSFENAVSEDLYKQWKTKRETAKKCPIFEIKRQKTTRNASFDFLDYFGFPCLGSDDMGEISYEYKCAFFGLECFGGKMEIWVANGDRTEDYLKVDYHYVKLQDFLHEVQTIPRKRTELPSEDILKGYEESRKLAPNVPTHDRKLELSDYLKSAFSNLHESLLESLDWTNYPLRLFVLINSNLFSPKLRFFLSGDQRTAYVNEYNEKVKKDKHSPIRDEATKILKIVRSEKNQRKQKPDNSLKGLGSIEAACKMLENYEQSGTVSSLFKQRGFYELFFENTSFEKHPILYKEKTIKNDWQAGYSYSEDLRKIEPFFLLTLPNVDKKDMQYQFAMIPFFFRGRPFGCIAFFNPKPRNKSDWYEDLNKILAILDEKEVTIYEAAIKDVCQNILKEVEGFKNE